MKRVRWREDLIEQNRSGSLYEQCSSQTSSDRRVYKYNDVDQNVVGVLVR